LPLPCLLGVDQTGRKVSPVSSPKGSLLVATPSPNAGEESPLGEVPRQTQSIRLPLYADVTVYGPPDGNDVVSTVPPVIPTSALQSCVGYFVGPDGTPSAIPLLAIISVLNVNRIRTQRTLRLFAVCRSDLVLDILW